MPLSKKERGICELYAADPETADWLVFGRRWCSDRRGFLKGAGLAAMGAAVGGALPFAKDMPGGLIPAALAETTEPFALPGKDGLTVLNDRPINAETPAHLLDDPVTPTARHFVRNNGLPPDNTDPDGWTLTVDGAVENPLTLTIDELKDRFEVVEYALQLECGGNGRAGFNPPASGNQWTVGAIGNSRWQGVRLADVLEAAKVKPEAVYTGHLGADRHLSGDPSKAPLSRGVPVAKAMNPYNLIAFAQNGAPIHPLNGAPLRLVVPGWPGSCSQKWLTGIRLSPTKWTGTKMAAPSYSVPAHPVYPGQEVAQEDFVTIHSHPVKSLITTPASGITLEPGVRQLEVGGHAWAGDDSVAQVDLTHNFGRNWTAANLEALPNPYSWATWRATVTFEQPGYYEIWARATDDRGHQQPFTVAWNPKGYLNNAMHRIAVLVS